MKYTRSEKDSEISVRKQQQESRPHPIEGRKRTANRKNAVNDSNKREKKEAEKQIREQTNKKKHTTSTLPRKKVQPPFVTRGTGLVSFFLSFRPLHVKVCTSMALNPSTSRFIRTRAWHTRSLSSSLLWEKNNRTQNQTDTVREYNKSSFFLFPPTNFNCITTRSQSSQEKDCFLPFESNFSQRENSGAQQMISCNEEKIGEVKCCWHENEISKGGKKQSVSSQDVEVRRTSAWTGI